MKPPVFFQPADGWVGDVIPFEKDGEFLLFYLHDIRTDPKPGTSWNLVSTRDLVCFDDRGVALEHGTETDADFNAYTGSVVVDGAGTHHLFYTGQNPRNLGEDGLPLQLVMHATSPDDMKSWTKHPEHAFGAPTGYESADWRDPFVFWDGSSERWRMLLAARHTGGPERRRGVIAEHVSRDLVNWEVSEPFWDPRRYVTHECPDVFHWGDWWYLVYSEFSESFTTRYRVAKSPDGPWTVPALDSVDGRAFYASKTAERDGRRFFFGWVATKAGSRDDGPWEWAGTMSVLEAHQNADGSLAFSFPDELAGSFQETVPITFKRALPATLESQAGFDLLVSNETLPSQFFVTARFVIERGTSECGVLLRSSADGDQSYIIRLEPKRRRVVFDRWPRKATGDMQWQVSGDVPFEIELERPCDLSPGGHTIEVAVDGTLCVVVIDGQVALSTRLYDRPNGRIGVFVGEGSATIHDIQVRQRTDH